jgi:hypothetical protein
MNQMKIKRRINLKKLDLKKSLKFLSFISIVYKLNLNYFVNSNFFDTISKFIYEYYGRD